METSTAYERGKAQAQADQSHGAEYDENPTPPIPAPTETLVNLETNEIVVDPKKK